MKSTFLSILFFLTFFQISFAQINQTQLIVDANKCIANAYSPILFYEKTGTIEQTQSDISQRIKLEEIGNFKVTKNSEGFNVDISCRDSNGCITLIRNNNTTTQINVTSFLFSDDARANSFVDNLSKLVLQYKKPEQKLSVIFFKNEQGKPNFYLENKNEETGIIPAPKTNTNIDIKEKDDADENAEKITTKIKKSPIAKESDDDADEEKPAPKTKSKKDVSALLDKEEEEQKTAPKSTKDLCGQINQLLKIANDKNFKSIEGAETNAAKKINDSKFKLKGAKRNYLNWYNNQRAFIAELKTSTDYESLMFDFDNIQTEIEECLGADWDNNDMASNKEYENFEGDVRDVEYAHIDKKLASSVRIILIGDQDKKYTLFIRIQ